jgi:hypothetical protein
VHLVSKRFETGADVKQAVTSWLEALDNYFFYAGHKSLLHSGTSVIDDEE